MLHNDERFKGEKVSYILLNKVNKRANRCRYDERLNMDSFFKTYRHGVPCYHYTSQHRNYVVMVLKGGTKLYSTNGISFSGTPLATHSVIEGVFGI